MPAEVVGMTDEAGTAEPLGAGSYDGRKSAVRVRPERGVEVQVRPVRRRNWPDEDKLRMVRETLQPGAVVQAVADRYGVSSGQLYTWRKEMLAAAGGGGRDAWRDRDRLAVRCDGTRQRPGGHGGAARRVGRARWPLMFGPPPGTRVYLACGA